MEIKIARNELLKGLSLLQGIVERKTTMPILSNVLIDAGEKGLSLTATDLDVGINCVLKGDIIDKGKATFHARSVHDIARELPDDTVHIKVSDGSRIEIKCGRSVYRITGLPPEEFPELPAKGDGPLSSIESETIVQMTDKAAFAMSTDETRYNLNGVYLDPVKGKDGPAIRMVATDGHRLSIVERKAGPKVGMEKGAIIPRKGVNEIKKLAEGAEGAIKFWTDGKHFIAYGEGTTLVIRLIDGQFPPYEQVIPKSSKRVISINREAFIHALRRVSVLSSDRTKGVKFSVSPKNLEITASNPDLGEAKEELDITYKGESFDIGFNARYFLEAMSVLEDEIAVLEMGDETSPCVIRSEVDRGFTHVIMPMRL